MKKITHLIYTQQKISKYHKKFYLNIVKLDDGEVYSLAYHKPAQIGDEVESWWDDKYQKACAKYPGPSPLEASRSL